MGQFIGDIQNLGEGGQRKVIATGQIVPVSRLELITRLIRTKFAPSSGFLTDLAEGATIIGEELEPTPAGVAKIAKEKLLPMVMNDFWDAIDEEGWLEGSLISIPSLLGWGQVTIPKKARGRLPEVTPPAGGVRPGFGIKEERR